jgi:RNA polymerase sigma factor (sigma-70 family)
MNMGIAVAPARTKREVEFLSRYDQLLKLAQKLTDADRSLAQDVVHDAFVQFMLSSTDYGSIDNVDHYLHKVVRNVHRTHIRQRSTGRLEQLSETTQDATPMPFTDPYGIVQARNLLVTICRYVCQRKDTSIASSILVLRFLHGYYPNEVAKLTHRTRSAVDGLLKSARRDLKGHLSKQPVYHVGEDLETYQASDSWTGVILDGFGMRRILFDARKGQCFDQKQLQGIYSNANVRLSRFELSHLVSCPPCLDEANVILHLPLLRDRSPIDVLSKIPIVLSLILTAQFSSILDWGMFWYQNVEGLSSFF